MLCIFWSNNDTITTIGKRRRIMKKKLTFITVLGAILFSLTACQLFNQNNTPGYSYRPYGSTSKQVTPEGDLEAISPDCTYGDYIKNNVYHISSTPSLGKAKLLVVPVWFNDSTSFIRNDHKDDVREDISLTYFGKNTDTGWRSVKSYYEEESQGKLKIDGTVSNWYNINESYQNYRTDGDHNKTNSLVKSAVEWYFTTDNPSDNRTDYDCDKDGYLDGVVLIYAAPDHTSYGNGNSNLWAYCFWLQNVGAKSVAKPGANVYFWASYDFMYSKSKAISRTGHNYGRGDTSNGVNVDAHTYIHETGHMFGLEDYYDYSSLQYMPAAAFSMQDQNVGGHDPFSSFALGWGKAYIPTNSANIILKPFVSSGEMIVLSPNWNEYNSPFDEYLILEYYTTDGLNYFDTSHPYMNVYSTGSSERGIRLWHVDARLLYIPNSSTPFSASRITTDPKISGNKVTHMLSNSYNDGVINAEHLSPLATRDPGEDRYSNYKLLELIRNSTVMTGRTKESLRNSDLFKAGDSFSMSKYTRQFVNNAKLNNGSALGFTFQVNELNDGYASISVTKS